MNGYAVSPGSLRGGTWHNWPTAPGTDSPAAAVETRLAALTLAEAADHAALDVVIDSGLTRMQVIRFPAGVRKPLERSAYLKAAFRNVFGREAADWHIIAEPTYASEPVPAFAIDATVMSAITGFAERHKLTLRSLRPSFVDCFNSLRNRLAAHTGAFALIESGRVGLGLWRHREWISLSSQAFAAEDGEALGALCTQMLARVDPAMPSGTLYIAGADKPFSVPLPGEWDVQWLAPETGIATRPQIRSKIASRVA